MGRAVTRWRTVHNRRRSKAEWARLFPPTHYDPSVIRAINKFADALVSAQDAYLRLLSCEPLRIEFEEVAIRLLSPDLLDSESQVSHQP